MKRPARKPVVILFGFSGSGKSTLANLLGRRLGLRVVHPSGILRDLMLGKIPDAATAKMNRGFWESKKGFAMLQGRVDDTVPMDVAADKILFREIRKGDLVMDSWTMPWLSERGIKIYLKAPLAVRARRIAVRSRLSEADALRIVRAKDADTRKLFRRVYGFDIAKDLGVFDATIDTARLTKVQVLRKLMGLLALPVVI